MPPRWVPGQPIETRPLPYNHAPCTGLSFALCSAGGSSDVHFCSHSVSAVSDVRARTDRGALGALVDVRHWLRSALVVVLFTAGFLIAIWIMIALIRMILAAAATTPMGG